MAAGNTSVAITAGSGTNIACYADASANEFQRVIAAPEDTQLATYSAIYKAGSIGTAATTNILTFAGAASKIIKVTRISVAATASTAASYFDILVNRQSTADTGGTAATAATIIKYDTSDSAASAAAPIFYTAGPTAGTVTGTLGVSKIFAPITGTPAAVSTTNIVDSTARPAKAVTLRGVTDVLAVTVNAVTPANATSWDIFVEWTEQST